jgi:hypothetical protein
MLSKFEVPQGRRLGGFASMNAVEFINDSTKVHFSFQKTLHCSYGKEKKLPI